jgi:hypothetical protein
VKSKKAYNRKGQWEGRMKKLVIVVVLLGLTMATVLRSAHAETVMLNCTGSQTAKFSPLSPVTSQYNQTISLNFDEKTMRFVGGGTTVIPVTLTDEIISFDAVIKHNEKGVKDSHFAGTLQRFSGLIRITESGGNETVSWRNETTATCTIAK